jgi:hypothetical protein
VVDDGYVFGCGILARCKMSALYPGSGIIKGVHISGGRHGKTLDTHKCPGFVHHLKHCGHALVFFAEKGADARSFVSQSQGAGSITVNAHLFFKTGAYHIVEFTQGAVFINQVFGHQENGYAGGAGGIAFNAGQDRVDNVFGQVVLAVGNKYFTGLCT